MFNLRVRPAEIGDQARLAAFLNFQTHIHRHLDWRSSLDWLGQQPFLIAETNHNLEAILACPPDPPRIAWVRIFAASNLVSLKSVWDLLLNHVVPLLNPDDNYRLVALALQDWFERLLVNSGFVSQQKIVVLDWNGKMPAGIDLPHPIVIRKMDEEDLPVVKVLDQLAFEPLWHNSLDALTLAFRQSSYNTVAVAEKKIVGYQISTSIPFNGHLARLAVDPTYQGQNIGYNLVYDLLQEFKKLGVWRVTVNTQSDNYASLALYEKMGFHRTGELFPVYEYPLRNTLIRPNI
jgi:ribosomal protein S18 acetylase RimI-like enzyme